MKSLWHACCARWSEREGDAHRERDREELAQVIRAVNESIAVHDIVSLNVRDPKRALAMLDVVADEFEPPLWVSSVDRVEVLTNNAKGAMIVIRASSLAAGDQS